MCVSAIVGTIRGRAPRTHAGSASTPATTRALLEFPVVGAFAHLAQALMFRSDLLLSTSPTTTGPRAIVCRRLASQYPDTLLRARMIASPYRAWGLVNIEQQRSRYIPELLGLRDHARRDAGRISALYYKQQREIPQGILAALPRESEQAPRHRAASRRRALHASRLPRRSPFEFSLPTAAPAAALLAIQNLVRYDWRLLLAEAPHHLRLIASRCWVAMVRHVHA